MEWQRLFDLWSKEAHKHGVSIQTAMGAAINMLIVCIRNAHADRVEAEKRFDEVVGKTKGILMDCYDPVTGKRRNIFPFHQVINPPGHKDPEK